ncbi:MAG TPA: hypothetical protein VJ793_01935 [Anaerolineae bacterium]|nr:hypothetical protein [Anaerolineae bacterium]
MTLKGGPYGYPRAFTINPSAEDLLTMGDLLEHTWGTRELSVLDPFAGGGSIPFEALRYGFTTIANDLNPVAAVILKATLDYPARFGPSLAEDIRKWGDEWAKRVKEKLDPYFPKRSGESIFAYLWARTVACPSTSKPVPLSPNWWLRKGSDPVAVRLIAEDGMSEPRFEIVAGAKVKSAKPDVGTITRGVARSPWTGETIDGDYIKAEAQAGRMGQMLYAVAFKQKRDLYFRPPTEEDVSAIKQARADLAHNRRSWDATGLIPNEPRQPGRADWAAEIYGLKTWADSFAPRQLFTFCTALGVLRQIEEDSCSSLDEDRAQAIVTYLSLAFDKALDYNSTQVVWHASRQVIAHTFQRHDFSVKWTFAEFDAARSLFPWVIDQVIDAYKGLADLVSPAQTTLMYARHEKLVDRLRIFHGLASSLVEIPDRSISNISVDPPYYDNVQYAELSDFFYVWLKRGARNVFPSLFREELTNKDDEAIANFARFKDMGRSRKELAERDYEFKMAAAFCEMYRVLRTDGSLTVMFTHKRVEAWDTLASALIGAGFAIKASWPVHTESETSLHQAKKNAASSTILLVCRKRQLPVISGQSSVGSGQLITDHSSLTTAVWWDDLQPRVRETARQKAAEFAAMGISGVDLYISVFGPTLSIISEHWPVLTSEVDPKTGQPKPLRPETALDLAREEVVRLRKQGLLLGRDVQFDPITDWYVMAWDAFGAEQFPYDEARKLAIALGLDVEKDLMKTNRLVTKKGQYVVMQTPVQRRRKGVVDDEVATFEHLIDAVHTAMMVYEEDGAGACDVFLKKSGLKTDGAFKACLQALLNAIPRSRIKGKFARPEAEVLENLRLAFFDDLQAPVEEEPELAVAAQLGLGEGFEEEGEEGEEDE